VAERALELSRSRRAAADRLGSAIGSELGSLGMGGARVLVEVEPTIAREASSTLSVPASLLPGLTLGPLYDSKSVRLGRDGIDRVEFLISPNKGIDPKPLRKIASGGELSRALLALKRVLAGSGHAGLYVFDEVDSGVGGAIAERIGAAIAEVAGHHQVLCITHLAPIAAFARSHFVVEKSAAGDVTKSKIRHVDGADREREVARMLSGSKISAAAIEAAREMIAASCPAAQRTASTAHAPASPAPSAPAAGTTVAARGRRASRSS
jgi:DNA repair protein RecN (Recombination protein N)